MNDKPSMTTADFLKLAEKGSDAWNEWADANPGETADFTSADFSQSVSFYNFKFPGPAEFRNATFSGHAEFRNATFSGYAEFRNATFNRDAEFIDATFSGTAEFTDATFNGIAEFRNTMFSGIANFSKATLNDAGRFSEATISGDAAFNDATISGDAEFIKTTFSGNAGFVETTFNGGTTFRGARFNGVSEFYEATFNGDVSFSEATLNGYAGFRDATFARTVYFEYVDVQITANFTGAEFLDIPSFQAVRNPERIVFDAVEFALPKPGSWAGRVALFFTGLCRLDRSIEDRIRNLRGIANKTHSIDVERDLSILERNAQVNALWVEVNEEALKLSEWLYRLSGVLAMTLSLLLFRWTSDYGRSVLRPLICLISAPFIWFVIYLKLYLTLAAHGTDLLSESKWEALKSLAMFGAFPVGNTLRSTYSAAIETLFGNAGNLLLPFQIGLTLQSIISLIFIFLIGLALRNFFRLK